VLLVVFLPQGLSGVIELFSVRRKERPSHAA
jgi:hypothetical protein